MIPFEPDTASICHDTFTVFEEYIGSQIPHDGIEESDIFMKPADHKINVQLQTKTDQTIEDSLERKNIDSPNVAGDTCNQGVYKSFF